jgi:hypothetical protein
MLVRMNLFAIDIQGHVPQFRLVFLADKEIGVESALWVIIVQGFELEPTVNDNWEFVRVVLRNKTHAMMAADCRGRLV